jgi:hypothetical protein
MTCFLLASFPSSLSLSFSTSLFLPFCFLIYISLLEFIQPRSQELRTAQNV